MNLKKLAKRKEDLSNEMRKSIEGLRVIIDEILSVTNSTLVDPRQLDMLKDPLESPRLSDLDVLI